MRLFVAISISMCALCTCTPLADAGRYNYAVKNAFIMYSRRSPETGAPPLQVEKSVYEYGKEDFVDALLPALATKYRVEAAYSLGWFGDRRQVRALRPLLTDSDPEVQRVALEAMSRLVHIEFESPSKAETWLKENEQTLP